MHYRIVAPEGADHPPLMCFHLSPLSGMVYENLLVEMGKDRVAVAPDTPGFGASDPPHDQPTIGDYADAMADLAETLGLGPMDVMGYHTGSKISIELALSRPDLVRRLVLVSTPIYNDAELEAQKATLGRPLQLDESGAHLLEVWQGHWRWRGPGQDLELVQAAVTEAFRGGPGAWWGHRAAFEYQMADRLPLVEQPVMVLCPEDDLYEPTLRAASLIKNGKLVELRGWGHGMLDVKTLEVGRMLREFLDG